MTRRNDIAEFPEHEQLVRHDVEEQPGRELTVDIVRDRARFAALQGRWNALVLASSATIYQTYEWLSLWWKYFHSEHCLLWIIVFRHGKDIVGIAPFFLEAETVFGFRIRRRLRMMGSCVPVRSYRGLYAEDGPSDYLDLIVLPEYAEDVARELVVSLEEHASLYDEIDLENVPDGSILLTKVMPALHADGNRCSVRRTQMCPRLNVPDSVDLFLKRLQPGVRRKFQQARKTYWQKPLYAIERVETESQVPSVFRDLVILHQQRWNRAGYVGLFCDKRFEGFQREFAQVSLERGWLWLQAATMAGVRVGVRLGFVFKERYFDYLSGFDERAPWGKSRPGIALLRSMIDDAIDHRADIVDFLRGDEQY
ncbi:MAG: GNAT family N-acetyltransferase, partial [Bacteroidota bacterium]